MKLTDLCGIIGVSGTNFRYDSINVKFLEESLEDKKNGRRSNWIDVV